MLFIFSQKNMLLLVKEKIENEVLQIEKTAKKNEPDRKARDRKIKGNMGMLMYYMCPMYRDYFDPTVGRDYRKIEQERLAAQKLKDALAHKTEDVTNPETAEWHRFTKKVEDDKDYVITRHLKTEKNREIRTGGRAERKAKRKNQIDPHHVSTNI